MSLIIFIMNSIKNNKEKKKKKEEKQLIFPQSKPNFVVNVTYQTDDGDSSDN